LLKVIALTTNRSYRTNSKRLRHENLHSIKGTQQHKKQTRIPAAQGKKEARNILSTFDSGVEDAESEPVEVVVHGRQVVHVEHHRRPGAVLPPYPPRVPEKPGGATDPAALASRSVRGLSWIEIEGKGGEAWLAGCLRIFRFAAPNLIWFEARKGKSANQPGNN